MRLAVLLAAVLAPIGVAGVAARTEPGVAPAELLTFVTNDRGKGHGVSICIARADGTSRRRLISGRLDDNPSWSPNGASLAFSRTEHPGDEAETSDILVATARGRVLRNLTKLGAHNVPSQPAWSPDGKRIAFVDRTRMGGELDVAGARGGGFLSYSNGLEIYAAHPTWSHNGKQIVYDVIKPGDTSEVDLHVIRSDLLTPDSLFVADAEDASYSPDGSKLVYSSVHGDVTEVVVANADGSDPHLLAEGGTGATWSPSGTRIAFARGGQDGRTEVVVVRADGTGKPVAIRSAHYSFWQPAWRPAAPLPHARRALCAAPRRG